MRTRVRLLRRRRWNYQRIVAEVGVSKATVCRILRRAGLNRLSALEPKEPPRRYVRERPGELLHLDIKKLGKIKGVGHRIHGDRRRRARGIGWEFLHVCIDDCSRIAYVELMADERKESAFAFLRRALLYYERLGIKVERIMTDNGACYRSKLLARLCEAASIRHIFTRPYTPRTNGKAERFIQTAIREWAYAHAYRHSAQRAKGLLPWLHAYNWHRPHSALNNKPPISTLPLLRNNVLRLHS